MPTPTSGSQRSPRSPRSVRFVLALVLSAASILIASLPGSAAGSRAKAVARTRAAARARARWQRFTGCDRLVTYLRNEALPYVGPYGLDQGGGPIAVTNGRVTDKTTTGRTAKAPASIASATGAATIAASATTAAAAATGGVSSASVTPAPVAPSAGPAPAAAQAAASAVNNAADSSKTNTQEVNVDEGDIVENDGRFVYSVVDGRLRIVDTTASKEVATVGLLPGNGGEPQLLLDGPRLAVAQVIYSTVGPETVVSLLDVTNPAAPSLLNRTHLEGQLVALRSIDHRARLVLQTSFGQRLGFLAPSDGSDASLQAATAENRRIVRRSPVSEWLPRTYREGPDGSTGPVHQGLSCGEVGRPEEFSGFGITWTATLDLNTDAKRVDAIGSAGVVGSGGVVYASGRRLYVSTQSVRVQRFGGGPIPVPVADGPVITRSGGIAASPRLRPIRAVPPTSVIHAFDLSPADGAAYIASGTVDGSLLNQFSMSEFAGYLRVATTSADAGFGGTTESQVRVLERAGGDLNEVATLGGLGRNERIYAVRFVGDIGFIVTFRQTDPLFVIDLRDPLTPRLAGQLKIPGASAYLQPIGDGQMLGIGQNATPEGRRLGTQISLFDVRDLAVPQLLATLPIGNESEAEYDHHAFLWWAPTRSVVVPTSHYPQGPTDTYRTEVVVATVGQNTVTEKGRITHTPTPASPNGDPTATVAGQPGSPFVPTTFPPGRFRPPTPIRRSLVVAGRLVTVSGTGVKVNDLNSLVELGWAPFSQ